MRSSCVSVYDSAAANQRRPGGATESLVSISHVACTSPGSDVVHSSKRRAHSLALTIRVLPWSRILSHLRLFGAQRQLDGEGGALALRRGQPQRAAVTPRDLARDVQTEPEAALVARCRRAAKKRREQLLALIERDARPVIDDVDGDVSVGAPRAHQ